MTEKEKILRAWERCDECHKHPIGMSEAYVECEYTMWLYCRQDALILDTVELIKKIPDIVMCKDCKHWYKDEVSHLCALTGDLRKPEWFCADGERKEGR